MSRMRVVSVIFLVALGASRSAWAHGACSKEERQGEFAYYRGEYQVSIDFYQQAVEKPCGATAFWPNFMIGMNYCALGDWASCEQYSRKAIELYPGNNRPYVNLGHALLELGRIDEAIQRMEEGLAHDASHEMLHNNLGVAYLIKGQPATAVQHFQHALYWNEGDPLIHQNLKIAKARAQMSETPSPSTPLHPLEPPNIQAPLLPAFRAMLLIPSPPR